ncbi:flagellin [Aureimonas sp. AU22]|uniref:flagellin N-terminal helical domain-containing protein n=1 Tax=Aureimonas sp. AU22 TaxID=1638162 RepID=UPI0007803698|nr:flagellin [Aureimonas sp. AU22]
MSSINFNSAATQALRTLQTSNTQLDATQKRISTGLAIGEAKDNAAYWSISTTMKSDNKALSTVTDALGLGAATLDTAYQGLSASKDVLDEIKSKLTAALGSNVDRTAIQAEIESLQEQLKSIANSSTFSGENWLSVNSGLSSYDSDKTIVSSFTRDISGNVTVGEIQIDTRNTVLLDSNTAAAATKKGILDSEIGLSAKVGGVETALTFGGTAGTGNSTNAGGLTTTAGVAQNGVDAVASATKAKLDPQTFAFTKGTMVDGDDIQLTFTVDGTPSVNVTVDVADADDFDIDDFLTAFATGATAASATIAASKDADGKLVFTNTSSNTGAASTLQLTAVITHQDATPATTRTGTIGFTTAASRAGLPVSAAKGAEVTVGAFGGSTAVTLDENDTIKFDVTLGSTTTKVTVNQAIVNEALSVPGTPVTDGKIDDVADYQKVVALALTKAGIPASTLTVEVSTNSGDTDKLLFKTVATGAAQSLTIGNAVASNGGSTISVTGMDITDDALNGLGAITAEQRVQAITAYINVVNGAINKVTAAASSIGAVSKRVELQQTFVQNLMDTIEQGISGLVDADMNEESTKLQALQVKQQLGVQALSIANQSAQNVLRLFQ